MLFLKGTSAQACGGYSGDDWEYYSSIIDQGLLANQDLVYFLSDEPSRDQNLSESHQNIDLWIKYLGGKLPHKDVHELIYSFTSDDILAIRNKLEQRNIASQLDTQSGGRVEKNKMAQYLLKNKMLDEITYIYHAKEAAEEADSMIVEWYWQNDEGREKFIIGNTLEVIEKYVTSEKSDFLKERMLYQNMRLLSYAGFFEESTELYKSVANLIDIESNLITGWIHGILGRNYFYTSEPEEAAYHWVKLYELATEKYVPAAQSLLWTGLGFYEILPLCKTDSEKRSLAFLLGSSSDFWLQKEGYGYLLQSPSNDVLEMIALIGFREFEKSENKLELAKLYRNCEEIASMAKPNRQFFWKALAASSALLSNNSQEAEVLIHDWENRPYYNERIKNQWRVLKLVDASLNKSSIEMERAAYEVLPNLSFSDEQYGWAQYLSHHYMLASYQKDSDSVKIFAAYLNSTSLPQTESGTKAQVFLPIERYGDIYWYGVNEYLQNCSDEVLLDIVDFLSKDEKNNFFRFYTGMINPNVILDFAMTRAASQLDWESAQKFGEMMDKDQSAQIPFQEKLLLDPFLNFFEESKFSANKDSGGLGEYTKLQVIDLIKKIKSKADRGNKKACLDYATALYNSSFYGNNWLLNRYAWSSYEDRLYFAEGRVDMINFGTEYFELYEAEKYANRAAQDPSLSDEANYVAALSVQHRALRNLDPYGRYLAFEYLVESWHNPYFDKINTGNKEIARFCSYYQDYLNGRK